MCAQCSCGSVEGGVSRRALVGSVGVAGAVALTACGSSGESEQLTQDSGPAAQTDMGAVADVPVGGVIKATAAGVSVMISQPVEGEFHAFSAVCTHQGCQLNAQKEKTINCPCHASVFSLTDGAVQGGPAETPLPEFPVEIKDGRILVG